MRWSIDWFLLVPAVLITLFGLITMWSIGSEGGLASRQVVWLAVSLVVFTVISQMDLRFLRRTEVVVGIYVTAVGALLLLFSIGSVFQGAQSWFNFGFFAIQPADPAKLAVIILLAKYFSRRHIEIAHLRHIIVSGLYVGVMVLLLFLQPDFGGAIIVAGVWGAMVLVAGIPIRRLLLLAGIGAGVLFLLWNFGFADYQKTRILTFLNPLADVQGAGYNAFQSTIAVGSGGILGKGVGYGTQSRLQFLPEHETDFIFAAFAEEWGLVGVMILLTLFGLIMYRLQANARMGATNFESLFAFGVAAIFLVHAVVHIGMNIGLLPVTGLTLPFMSYGGSHLLTEYAMLGMISAMRRYNVSGRSAEPQEVVGVS
ncbi:MAG: rod shape-determining protein RodA, rod shape determining protein RodA [Candidatus Parcubacteria bacterium]